MLTFDNNILVKTINLTNRYGEITAVNNLNLEVEKATVYGLLGPNGAGKTTTILMLIGLTEPSDGKVLVGGYDSTRNPIEVKSLAGYLPDNVGFYQELTGRENLFYTASLNGLSKKETVERIETALERVGIKEASNRKVGGYSRGMRQRLGIADILVKNPQLIILDEPTLGIDPEGVRELLELIKSLARDDGRTILISSHLLQQVQQICDKVGIFVDGKLIANGSIDELGEQLLQEQRFILKLAVNPKDDQLIELCQTVDGVEEIKADGDLLKINSSFDIRQPLVHSLMEHGYSILHLHMEGFSLDDIYRRYFQKEEENHG